MKRSVVWSRCPLCGETVSALPSGLPGVPGVSLCTCFLYLLLSACIALSVVRSPALYFTSTSLKAFPDRCCNSCSNFSVSSHSCWRAANWNFVMNSTYCWQVPPLNVGILGLMAAILRCDSVWVSLVCLWVVLNAGLGLGLESELSVDARLLLLWNASRLRLRGLLSSSRLPVRFLCCSPSILVEANLGSCSSGWSRSANSCSFPSHTLPSVSIWRSFLMFSHRPRPPPLLGFRGPAPLPVAFLRSPWSRVGAPPGLCWVISSSRLHSHLLLASRPALACCGDRSPPSPGPLYPGPAPGPSPCCLVGASASPRRSGGGPLLGRGSPVSVNQRPTLLSWLPSSRSRSLVWYIRSSLLLAASLVRPLPSVWLCCSLPCPIMSLFCHLVCPIAGGLWLRSQ